MVSIFWSEPNFQRAAACCGVRQHAAACFKTPTSRPQNQVLQHAVAFCGMLRHASTIGAWSGHKAYRTVDRPQTPRWRSPVGDAAMPACMCPCVSERGGGGVAHLLAPLLFSVGARGAGKCVPGAPGPGREAGETDAQPTRGDVDQGSQPPHHKNKLPNCSTNALRHGKAVVHGTTGVRLTLLDCLRHRWCCHVGWVWLPSAERVPQAGGGAPGRRECFLALGATGASCTGCGATARVDEGAQRAPHPNGLSVDVGGGGGRGGGGLHRGCAGDGVDVGRTPGGWALRVPGSAVQCPATVPRNGGGGAATE